ncbi:hypothetical protein vseg_011507 [Gypsophila vaccaria]
MDRQPQSLEYHSSSMTVLETGLAALSDFFTRRWRRWAACYIGGENEPVIHLQQEEMMFNPQGTGGGTGGGQSQQFSGPVWQKHILMGGKCELPDFSGVIIYDPAGNVVTPAKPPRLALPWK